jgi:hypothetical protein
VEALNGPAMVPEIYPFPILMYCDWSGLTNNITESMNIRISIVYENND